MAKELLSYEVFTAFPFPGQKDDEFWHSWEKELEKEDLKEE